MRSVAQAMSRAFNQPGTKCSWSCPASTCSISADHGNAPLRCASGETFGPAYQKLNPVCHSSDFDKLKTNILSTLAFLMPFALEEAAMKIFANFIRFIYRSEPPRFTAAPFDDGLAEIAQLIAREDPIKADALSAATAAAPSTLLTDQTTGPDWTQSLV
jgi:hypothetical protein